MLSEEMVPEELSVDEFLKLPEEQPPRATIDDSAIIEFCSVPRTLAQIAEHLQKSEGAVRTHMKSLVNKGKIVRRYQGKRALYLDKRKVP